ncbi:MAG TPA: flagellar basal body-associated FliL family protein [Roseovarius sp.]|nr:flagellar basal body-associated FliL family protein [Roseovarius sp.]
MIRMFLPVVLALAGTGAGVGAGLLLAPAAEDTAAPAETEPTAAPPESAAALRAPDTGPSDFVGLNNQFVVPILKGERIGAMVVMSLSIEMAAGNAQAVYAHEPKLRDGFLQVLFDHANRGGFDGEFTNANSMDVLRRMLSEVAQDLLGPIARSVLITEIARQDT